MTLKSDQRIREAYQEPPDAHAAFAEWIGKLKERPSRQDYRLMHDAFVGGWQRHARAHAQVDTPAPSVVSFSMGIHEHKPGAACNCPLCAP